MKVLNYFLILVLFAGLALSGCDAKLLITDFLSEKRQRDTTDFAGVPGGQLTIRNGVEMRTRIDDLSDKVIQENGVELDVMISTQGSISNVGEEVN